MTFVMYHSVEAFTQMNLIATFATKLRTCRDETRLDSAEHNVLMRGS